MEKTKVVREALAKIVRSYRIYKSKDGKYKEVSEGKCVVYELEEEYDIKPKRNESI